MIAVYYCEKRYDDCKAIHEASISFITLFVAKYKCSLYKMNYGTYCKKYVWLRREENERVFSKRYRFMSFLRLVVHDYPRGVSYIRTFKKGQVEGV